MSSGNAKIGQPAPDFSATAVVKGQFETVKLGDYKGDGCLHIGVTMQVFEKLWFFPEFSNANMHRSNFLKH